MGGFWRYVSHQNRAKFDPLVRIWFSVLGCQASVSYCKIDLPLLLVGTFGGPRHKTVYKTRNRLKPFHLRKRTLALSPPPRRTSNGHNCRDIASVLHDACRRRPQFDCPANRAPAKAKSAMPRHRRLSAASSVLAEK